MNRRLLQIGTVAVAIAVVAAIGVTELLRETHRPMQPTGPLALVERQSGSPQARTEGVLEITDECVRIIHPNGTSALVVWFQGAATWNAMDRSIVTTTPDGRELTLRNGDAVALTGGGGPAATLESAGSWVRRPGEACTPPGWFLSVGAQLADRN